MSDEGSSENESTGDIHELLARRRSPYGYQDRAVPVEDLRALFEAARWAASSYNEQPWRYVVARREDTEAFDRMLTVLVEANQKWARHAPVLAIGITSNRFARNDKPNEAARHDLGAASAQLTVEATRRGLHVHQMIGIQPERARSLYGIPEGSEALTALAIGYGTEPEDTPEAFRERDLAPRTRRPLRETVFEGSLREPASWLD